jgi:D-xylono/L-arabinono-1,4-lactonase
MLLKQSSETLSQQPEMIADCSCEIGENPLWRTNERRLYWTDIPNGRLFRYDPATGVHERCYCGIAIGGFTIQADGALLCFMDRGAIAILREGVLTYLVTEVREEKSSRFNDVIADPRGRVLCGTISTSEKKGTLYRLDLDGFLHSLFENVGCSKGMAFTLDRKGFCYTDSYAREIYLFNYDIEKGSIRKRRVFASFGESDGLPDGANLDREGCLWSALWDGSCIVRFLPDGQIDRRFMLPTRNVSSLTFGGQDYSAVYITTAGGNRNEEDEATAGALFRMRAPVQGLPEFFSRVEDPTRVQKSLSQ